MPNAALRITGELSELSAAKSRILTARVEALRRLALS
jgi:hypothetical protein